MAKGNHDKVMRTEGDVKNLTGRFEECKIAEEKSRTELKNQIEKLEVDLTTEFKNQIKDLKDTLCQQVKTNTEDIDRLKDAKMVNNGIEKDRDKQTTKEIRKWQLQLAVIVVIIDVVFFILQWNFRK